MQSLQKSRSDRHKLLTKTRSINKKIADWEKDFTAALTAYSKALTHTLTNKTHALLPRELRDQIYDHLTTHLSYGGDTRYPYTHYIRQNRQPKWMYAPCPRTPLPFLNPWFHSYRRHFEDRDFVGLPFARELLEYYYRKLAFEAFRNDGFGILGTWLRQQPCGYGVEVRQMLNHLKLTFRMGRDGSECMFMDWDNHGNYTIDLEKTKEEARKDRVELEERLSALLLLERKCRVSLSVGIWADEPGYFQFGELGKVLGPLVGTLRARGVVLSVLLSTYKVMSYGMSRRYSSWSIQGSPTSPIDEVLEDAMQVLRLPCVGEIDLDSVRKFDSYFEKDPEYRYE
ncbi:hypothetical protein CC78DRAFT_528610 [Lojkania enalia]|uniref:Uncharacterized protein n=1 Tax=Lojkania enalia TaxID=147567 RepID=A0A9P4NBH9_9PLEO|nr:hypothetical protein CC78DRAFT_528610 [Didymosphaeria enalia]